MRGKMNWYLQKSLEKQWKNASLSNNFIFCRVMSENLDLCKDFLEMLLNIQIERLQLSEAEKTIDVDFLSKGVRFDVYVKDGTGRCFDIEIQTTDRRNLPKRARYYQGILDISNLNQGFAFSVKLVQYCSINLRRFFLGFSFVFSFVSPFSSLVVSKFIVLFFEFTIWSIISEIVS